MKKTIIFVLAIAACVAAIAHSAALSRAQNRRAMRASANRDNGQTVSVRYPTLAAKRPFHPGPEPDKEYAVPAKRKQVGCKILRASRTRTVTITDLFAY